MLGDVEVPDGVCGEWCVETFTVSKEQSDFTAIRSVVRDDMNTFVPPGQYKRLKRGNVIVMSNTPMEIRTNQRFVNAAEGNVLINGLGLGMVLSAILEKPEVMSVTVIEVAEEVIKLAGPSFLHDTQVRIIHADAFEYCPEEGAYFDVVWHDIWDNVCSDNIAEMKKLHRKYAELTNWQESWAMNECRKALLSRK